MAGTLIVVDQGDAFAVVGPDESVLAHLSAPRLPDIVPAPVRDVGDRMLARLATAARAPGHPGADMASSRVGRLEAFDGDGRPVALRSVRGWLGRGLTGPDADPEAVLGRLRRVIAHVNAEAVRQNPRRTKADETLVRDYLARGLLPIAEPETFREAVELLWESRYIDRAGASQRLLHRSPLAPLVAVVESTVGSFLPARPQLPDPPPTGEPPIVVPHRGGWFHNLWHAATGTS
ncbi:MAG TPA: hypothetical protein VEV13_06730 [Candidatus Limnocylindria bacterium]|nr:hypothetical protein [Candidatus Limnocylindria bacterium]